MAIDVTGPVKVIGPSIERVEIVDRVGREGERETNISENYKVTNGRDHIESREGREREKGDISIE